MHATEHQGAEARRQQALVAALAAPPAEAVASAAVQAYRANAHAAAERALASACPTLRALLGTEAFAQLAREFWHADPPQRGDLGEWGAALPGWVEAHGGLAEWPYLADCARLDLALHRCERAADAVFDPASLALLASTEPGQLQLRLMPCVQALASRWPLASIHAAHAAHAAHTAHAAHAAHAADADADAAGAAGAAGAATDDALFDAVRERVRQGQGECVVVARDGWRGDVQRIDAPGLAFMQALAQGADLERALAAAGDGFDFATWLAEALRCGWLKEAVLIGD